MRIRLWSTDTEATASALVFPAPAGSKVVGEPSKWLAVDTNFQQPPAIEWTNLESLVRSERSLVANFRIQDAKVHCAAETCWLDHFENELGSVSNLWGAALSLQAASIGPSSQPAKLLLEVSVVGLAQRYWFTVEKNLMMQLLAYLLKATSLNQNPFARLSFAIDPLPENLQCLHNVNVLEIARACYGSKLLLIIKMWVNHWKVEILKLFPKGSNVSRFRYSRNFGFFFR